MPFGKGCAGEPDIGRVTDGSKVTDHHAIIPTMEIARTDLSELPSGERDVLTLIAARLLSATAQAHRFKAVTAVLDCRGHSFTAKGKTILQAGWKEVERLYRMGLKESKPEDDENTDIPLPMLQEGQIDRAFDTLKMFQENGALAGTVVRGFGESWEQPLSDIFTDMREPEQKPSVRRQLKKQPEAKATRQKTNHQQER